MTKALSFASIKKLQKHYGLDGMQKNIDSGQAWLFEGSVGREAMRLLESGACMLPKVFRKDYYGNRIPSRDVLKAGTKGTFSNSQNFWQLVLDGKIDMEVSYDEICEDEE